MAILFLIQCPIVNVKDSQIMKRVKNHFKLIYLFVIRDLDPSDRVRVEIHKTS